ncbi:amiloride-sensitive sodium channel subunit beta isoform X4 [Strongylocentrotus purpuratus]|uniref:Uncharacterized protein n=1 Tax=Strongylocentrotus purpuratus TaxID=7668 RepID=A0A7M7N9H1_STRPU|nr:amiloride-sensitive sodium channel subunit beta isoform X4 [Strongylocentrotus purpuratus]
MEAKMSKKQDGVAWIFQVKEAAENKESEFKFGQEKIDMGDLPRDTKTSPEKMADYSEKAYGRPDYDESPKEGTRKIVNEFVDNATTHGIPRVLNASRPWQSRLFWCVVTLIFAGVFLFQGSKLVQSYIARPTTTKISLITKSRLEFPAVTICNLNMLRRSMLKGDEYDYSGIEDIEDPNDWEALYNLSKGSDYNNFKNFVKPTKEELRTLGHKAKDFILQCSFDTEACSYENFTVIQNAEYGNCFVFNNAHKLKRGKRTTTSRTGSQYGLQLTLMVEQPEYIGILSPNSGVKVAIKDPRIYAFPEDDGIEAAPGFATSIGLTKTSISRLPEPYGNCIRKHDSFYAPEKYDFSQRSCLKLCLQETLNETCSCITDVLIDGTMCEVINREQGNCRNSVFKDFLKNKLNCDCSNACSETVFKPRIAISRWPTARYEAHLYDSLASINKKAARILTNVAQSRNNLVRLSVFYEELNFENVVETPLITVESLFGSLGGLLGLYIGMSFISVTEILVFIFELLRSVCCHKGYPSKHTKVSGR